MNQLYNKPLLLSNLLDEIKIFILYIDRPLEMLQDDAHVLKQWGF